MPNRELALELGRLGLFVFPCIERGPRRKEPYVKWQQTSTNCNLEIRQLWERWPGAAPAIDMGKSGLITIDCDKKRSDGLRWLQAQGWDVEDIPGSWTPGGGRHLICWNVGWFGNGRGCLPAKETADIDIRGDGGYILAPGAELDTGTYLPIGNLEEISELPDWAMRLLGERERPVIVAVRAEPVSEVRLDAYGQAALDALEAELAAAGEGSRNDTANRIAFRVGQLVAGGCLSESEALRRLENACRGWGVSPKDKVFGRKGTLWRGLRAGQDLPAGPSDEEVSVDISGYLNGHDLQTGEVIEFPTGTKASSSGPPFVPPDDELPAGLLECPGLVGEIANHINASAIQPQPGLALAAALVIVGTAAGRQIAGPTESGTHLYVIVLADSGSGKDHPLTAIKKIMMATAMKGHIGPSEFISMPAVINFVERTPLSCCAMDEFGAFLKRINSRKAGGFEASVSKWLRTLWGSSFKPVMSPEWAGRPTVAIHDPALSIFGVSTPEEFYRALEGGDIVNGALNRFLLFLTRTMPAKRVPAVKLADVPPEIVGALNAIYRRSFLNTVTDSRRSCEHDVMTFSEGAESVRDELDRYVRDKGDAVPSMKPFLARTSENAIRLATIRAVGCGRMDVEPADMAWGRDLAIWSTERMADECGLYVSDSENQSIAQAVKRVLKAKGPQVPSWHLKRALAHKFERRKLDDVITGLIETREVRVDQAPMAAKGSRPGLLLTLV